VTSASSSFSGIENPLSEGGVWTQPSSYWSAVQKSTGLKSVVLANDCAARYTGATFSADHSSQITLLTIPAGALLMFHYVLCRCQAANAGCYLLSTAGDVGPNILQLYVLSTSGGYTQIGANITLGANFAIGDTMKLQLVGTGLTCFLNGASVRTATDSTYSTGQPGVAGWAQDTASNAPYISAWSAADVAAGASSPPPPSRTPSWMFSV
jgi:hypothetical protein